MNAYFLAAGLGTRLRPYTKDLAKPAIPFLGLPQISYPYFFCTELGVQSFAYNTHHHGDHVESIFQILAPSAQRFHEDSILNSSGGIFNARHFLSSSDPSIVINADSLFVYQDISGFQKIISDHQKEKRWVTLVTVNQPGCGIHFPGLYFDEEFRLQNAGLNKSDKFQCSHFIGVYILSPDIFNFMSDQPQNMIHDTLLKLKDSHPIHVQSWPDVIHYELGTLKNFKRNHLELSSTNLDENKNSFQRTHQFFRSKNLSFYPYKQKLEKQILRSM